MRVSLPSCHICKPSSIGEVLRKKDIVMFNDLTCIKADIAQADTKIEECYLFIPADNAEQKILGSLGAYS